MVKYYNQNKKIWESIMSKVALKPLDTKSRTIISICIFVVVFTILITIASIYDFQVSQILTKNALKEGDYISNDFFWRCR